MQFLTLDDSEWGTTFPCRVAPSRDEWFVSLLLRCDEANHWESGTTFRYLLRAMRPLITPKSLFIVVPRPVLEYLAHPLLISPERLLATTFATELARIYQYPDPHQGLLLGLQYDPDNPPSLPSGPSGRATERKRHLCPMCIAETRTLRRTVALPYLQYCPLHQVGFQERCPCGYPLTFFDRGSLPFTCWRCGLDWGQWPHLPIPPDCVVLERSASALYEVFLSVGTAQLKASALRLARSALKGCESLELKLTERRINRPATHNLHGLSLGYAVDLLVSIGISLSDFIDDDIPYF
jgi:hypothetical protein